MTQTRRLLIVDDDADLRQALVEQLALHREFQVQAVETAEAAARYVADRLRRAVEQGKFSDDPSHTIQHLTISIGVAVYDSDARFKRDLIEASDAALYAAKREGRNRVVSYSDLVRREKTKAS